MKIKLQEFPKPNIHLAVKEGEKHLWKHFHPYHYMTANSPVSKSFPSSAKFYTFYWLLDGQEILVGCLGVMFQIASYPAKRLTRVVVLPEFQGLGISSKMINSISDYYTSKGFKVYGATYHPRLGEFRQKSPNWEAGHYNLREFKLSDDHEEKGMSGLRDGEIMYRHFYVKDTKYTLKYDIVEYDNLKKQTSEMVLTEENIEEYNEFIKTQRRMENEIGLKLTKIRGLEAVVSDEDMKRYKIEHQRNKRKILTSEERKKLKAEFAQNKTKTI